MMRILHATDVYRPQVGGIEVFVEDLAMRQATCGHEVTILTATATPTCRDDPSPVTVLRPRQHRIGLSRFLPQPNTVRQGGYDVVHAHLSVFSPFATAVARQAATAGVPTVLTVHSLWSDRSAVVRTVGVVAGWAHWPVMWTAVSEAAATSLARVVPHDGRVRVVPNAVDVPWWREGHERPDPVRGPLRPVTLVSVMRLASRKRPLPFLRTLRQVRRQVPDTIAVRAMLVGDGPLDGSVRAYLARHRMDEWVSLTGTISREAIRDIHHHAADIYVAPAHQESFGIAALEARAAGLPVVAMRSGGVREFIEHGISGSLCSGDDDIVAVLAGLIMDDDQRNRMSAHNAAVAPELDWANTLGGFDLAYAQAALGARLGNPRRANGRLSGAVTD